MKQTLILMLVCCLAACQAGRPAPTATVAPAPVVLRTPRASASPFPTPTRGATLTPEPSITPAMSLTPNPNTQYTIAALRFRQYGGGDVLDKGILGGNNSFSRHSITYPSDGLTIYGYVNSPVKPGKYPVIIAIHGYSDPTQYDTLDYTTDIADRLAEQGYIVVHPSLRNFRPSDSGDSLFRVGYAVDVLNLMAIIRQSAGKPGLFEQADASRLGLWGHSMGGNIALKVAVVARDVRAVFLYAPMSGDEQKNAQFFQFRLGDSASNREMLTSTQDFAAISPDTYYADINAAIQLHHGTGDSVLPVAWSEETCQQLRDARRKVECFYYDDAEHTFSSRYYPQFEKRMLDFFANNLKK